MKNLKVRPDQRQHPPSRRRHHLAHQVLPRRHRQPPVRFQAGPQFVHVPYSRHLNRIRIRIELEWTKVLKEGDLLTCTSLEMEAVDLESQPLVHDN